MTRDITALSDNCHRVEPQNRTRATAGCLLEPLPQNPRPRLALVHQLVLS